MSKESAAFLTVALMLSMVSLLTAVVIIIIGLWGYADTIISLVVLIGGLASLLWILNLLDRIKNERESIMTNVVIHGFFFWCRAEWKCDKKTNFL